MKQVTIKITGADDSDISLALEEVSRLVNNSYICGGDRNESGSYHFSIADLPEICNTEETSARRCFEVTRNTMGFTAPNWDELPETTKQLYRNHISVFSR